SYDPGMADPLTSARRSKLMAKVRTKDTAPELALRRALWPAGVRGWHCHPKHITGRPDLAWPRMKIAVFVDGAFWHGHPDFYRGQSGPFWDQKIAANRARDDRVNRLLEDDGWTILRLWDFDIDHDINSCVSRVREIIESKQSTDPAL